MYLYLIIALLTVSVEQSYSSLTPEKHLSVSQGIVLHKTTSPSFPVS